MSYRDGYSREYARSSQHQEPSRQSLHNNPPVRTVRVKPERNGYQRTSMDSSSLFSSPHQQLRRQRSQGDTTVSEIRRSSGGGSQPRIINEYSRSLQQRRIQRSQSDRSVGTVSTLSAQSAFSINLSQYSESSPPKQPKRREKYRIQRHSSHRKSRSSQLQQPMRSQKHRIRNPSSHQYQLLEHQHQRRQIPPSRIEFRQKPPIFTSLAMRNRRIWRPIQIRPKRPPPPRRGQRKYPAICNKCRKPLTKGTVYFLTCQCILCEGAFEKATVCSPCLPNCLFFLSLTFLFVAARFADCTFSHFSKNKNCPSCDRIMGDDDFKELKISQPPSFRKFKASIFQRIFCKGGIRRRRCLNASDMFLRIQRQHDKYRQLMRFSLNQFLKENKAQTKRGLNIHRTLNAMRSNQNHFEGEVSQLKKAIETYKQKLKLANQKTEEKEQQLSKLLKRVDSQNKHHTHREYNRGEEMSGRIRESSPERRVSTPPRRASDQLLPTHSLHDNSGYKERHHRGEQPEKREPTQPRRASEQHLPPASTNDDNRYCGHRHRGERFERRREPFTQTQQVSDQRLPTTSINDDSRYVEYRQRELDRRREFSTTEQRVSTQPGRVNDQYLPPHTLLKKSGYEERHHRGERSERRRESFTEQRSSMQPQRLSDHRLPPISINDDSRYEERHRREEQPERRRESSTEQRESTQPRHESDRHLAPTSINDDSRYVKQRHRELDRRREVSTIEQRTSTRPRRVSDEHLPLPSRNEASSFEQYYHRGERVERRKESSTRMHETRTRRVSDLHLPSHSDHRDRRHSHDEHDAREHKERHSRTLNAYTRDQRQNRSNPYEQQLDTNRYKSYHISSQPEPSRHRSYKTAVRNPYSESRPHVEVTQPSYGREGVSVTSSLSSGSAGGKIRRITENTGFSFSGSAALQREERKRSLSPCKAYTSNKRNPYKSHKYGH